jgi:16S rRNA (cytidine1402-2'-O)-methyltransferase
MKGILYLITTGLDENISQIPFCNFEIIKNLKFFIVEEIRTARRFLKKIDREIDIDSLEFYMLNEHTDISLIGKYLEKVESGQNIGLLSEAGTPCVADPGSEIVKIAHKKGVKVVPLSGPSSIVLALMSSGFNGQNFAFNGYLPIDKIQCSRKIKEFESLMSKNNQTQIFIETPYRNNQLLDNFLKTCNSDTFLCVATDLTSPTESVISTTINEWRKKSHDINKKPSVFLIYR